MGCASSRSSRSKQCEASYSPVARRSFSMNVYHPPEREGDTYHVVALTSSTLGSIDLEKAHPNYEVGIDRKEEFAMGMIEAKVWSNMIDEKIAARVGSKNPQIIDEKRTRVAPKTPVRTPPDEPETINVGDLMEGLEETSPLHPREHTRSFSFHVTTNSIDGNENLISEAILSEFDPELISTFRKALQELSPTNPFHIKPHGHEEASNGLLEEHKVIEKLNAITPIEVTHEGNFDGDSRDVTGVSFVENGYPHTNDHVEVIHEGSVNEDSIDVTNASFVHNCHMDKQRVVLYFTSLRGIRKTYEDCCYVRLTLKGLGVRVDERDVSMHGEFKEELKARLGDEFNKGGLLPRVFVGGKYIGGVDEIRRMHEDGHLEKLLEACEMLDDEDGGNLVSLCEACGDIRFLPCKTCSGSCKIYHEYETDEEIEEVDECGFRRCPDCNENGLIRCPICCY